MVKAGDERMGDCSRGMGGGSSGIAAVAVDWAIFFFFQAEDGIRDADVTGVSDVCSSDLYGQYGIDEMLNQRGMQYIPTDIKTDWAEKSKIYRSKLGKDGFEQEKAEYALEMQERFNVVRSEERRVGKECRCRWSS